MHNFSNKIWAAKFEYYEKVIETNKNQQKPTKNKNNNETNQWENFNCKKTGKWLLGKQSFYVMLLIL